MKNKKQRISIVALAVILIFAMSATAFGAAAPGSKDGALKIALANAKLSKKQVKQIDVEKEKNYEIEFVRKSNGAEYDYEISAKDGRILEKAVEYKYKKNTSKKKIGKDKARRIVADFSGRSYNDVKKGTCVYSYKNKKGKYEVKFCSGNYKHEYEVLAPNGKIIEYEYEYIGTR